MAMDLFSWADGEPAPAQPPEARSGRPDKARSDRPDEARSDRPSVADEPVDPIAPQVDLLAGLNPAQAEAVAHPTGPLLVVAGAGSGKTRVLTQRIAWLISDQGLSPFEILAITFTNKAAQEMRDRVESLVGPVARRMWVSTFHSACVRILRRDAARLGYRSNFTIYDQADTGPAGRLRVLGPGAGLEEVPAPDHPRLHMAAAKNELVDFEEYSAWPGP